MVRADDRHDTGARSCWVGCQEIAGVPDRDSRCHVGGRVRRNRNRDRVVCHGGRRDEPSSGCPRLWWGQRLPCQRDAWRLQPRRAPLRSERAGYLRRMSRKIASRRWQMGLPRSRRRSHARLGAGSNGWSTLAAGIGCDAARPGGPHEWIADNHHAPERGDPGWMLRAAGNDAASGSGPSGDAPRLVAGTTRSAFRPRTSAPPRSGDQPRIGDGALPWRPRPPQTLLSTAIRSARNWANCARSSGVSSPRSLFSARGRRWMRTPCSCSIISRA